MNGLSVRGRWVGIASAMVLGGCGGDGKPASASARPCCARSLVGCASDAVPSLCSSTCSVVPHATLHEHALRGELARVASIGDRVLLHLEPAGETTGDSRDTGAAGYDEVAYALPAGETVRFTVASEWVARVEIADAAGVVLATIAAGTSAAVPIPAGDGHVVVRVVSGHAEAGLVPIAPACEPYQADADGERGAALTAETAAIHVGAQPSQAVIPPASTAVAAFVGWAPAGPYDTATQVTSFGAYEQTFGALAASSHLGWAAWQFFANGGTEAYVVRVTTAGTAPTLLELVGDPSAKTGLHALDDAIHTGPLGSNVINLVSIPDLVDLPGAEVAGLLPILAQYVGANDLFMLLDPPSDATTPSALEAWVESNLSGFNGQNFALYAPRITVAAGGGTFVTGPSATVAGLYATSDLQLGVWASPSGPQLRPSGVDAAAFTVPTTELATWAALGVNLLHSTPGVGIALASARTLASAEKDRSVGARRTVAYVRSSLRAGLGWATFGPASAGVCSEIVNEVKVFLTGFWEEGALFGTTAAAAFSVSCDPKASPGHVLVVVTMAVDRAARTTVSVDIPTAPSPESQSH